MRVLGCETSCDETGLAVYDTGEGLLADVLHSQVDLHALYGGVVPELASRDHVRRLAPLMRAVMQDAGLAPGELDGVAYTAGPGLAGALMTGALAARALAWSLDIPALAVHHMEGHLLSPMLEPESPPFPFICLLVSGGHTQIVRVDGIGLYRLLGQSIDDAAGEAFDKTAKMLGLPYPGGAALSRLAEKGDPLAVPMPRPMLDRPGLDMSFSGLKTAAITRFRAFSGEVSTGGSSDRRRTGEESARAGNPVAGVPDAQGGVPEQFVADLAAGFEAAIVDVLVEKCRRALAQEGLSTLVIAGGVSANARLREALEQAVAARVGDAAVKPGGGAGQLYCPRLRFCTDNGAMIALAGALRLEAGLRSDLAVTIRPRWPLAELAALDRSAQ